MKKILTSSLFDLMNERKERIIIHEGGSRSSKTYSILQWIIIQMINNSKRKEPFIVICLRSKLTWLKTTLLADFKSIMKNQFELWDDGSLNKAEMIYYYGNAQIIFRGLDTDGGKKFHGLKSDIAWFNECIDIDYSSVQQIMQRSPGRFIFDFNPNCAEEHWIFKHVLKMDSSVCIHSTYKNNPFLQQSIIDNIEAYRPTKENIEKGTADETLWKIYGLGQRATLKGLIYKDFTFVKEFPPDCENICYGLDFGFTNDPTTLVKKGELNGEIYLEELIYETGLNNIINPHAPKKKNIEQRLLDLGLKKTSDHTIWADCAEPKSIDALFHCGFNILRCTEKGILNGIQTVQLYKLNIVEPSENLKKEITSYKWIEDSSGEGTNKPVKTNDHLMDAMRYAIVASCRLLGSRVGYAFDSVKPSLGDDAFGVVSGCVADINY